MIRSLTALPLAALLATLAACQQDQKVPTAAVPQPAAVVSAAPPAAAPAASTETSARAEAAEPAPSLVAQAAAQAPGVIATGEGETPGVRVEITEFKRTAGDTLTIRLAMINDSDKALSFNVYGQPGFDHEWGIGGIHLLEGKNTHAVARDASKHCLCSKGLDNLKPKSRIALWARFPAPPPSVERVSVVIPHFLPIDDVPIGR